MPELSPLRELMTTASQAPVIVNGTEEQLLELWQERVGLKPPKDFSHNIAVQRGRHDEPFILNWIEFTTDQPITERGAFLKHPTLPSISCTLDGYRAFDDAVIEAKTASGFRKLPDILAWYTPQVLVQMRCRGTTRGILAVLQDDLTELEVLVDEDYEREAWARLAAFQLCVQTMTEPVDKPPLVPPELWKTIDLSTVHPLPNWGPGMIEDMRLWSETRRAVNLHDMAKKRIKEMLPPDVGTILYGGLNVKRAKNGAVTIREQDR
jgi:hypothetical protein